MKLRRQIRTLYQTIGNELREGLINTHEHNDFYVRGSGCALCCLISNQYYLAALQLARERNAQQQWTNGERELYDLIGEADFKKRLRRELNTVRRLPKKVCPTCEGLISIFMRVSKTIEFMLSHNHRYIVRCENCGQAIEFTKKDFEEVTWDKVEKEWIINQSKAKLKAKRRLEDILGGRVQDIRIIEDQPDIDEEEPPEDEEPLFEDEHDIDREPF
jgi:hypothetical protein